MSERFDRWTANPETIALPQNYDEFLSKNELPCLVDNCDWKGKFLSCHMNFTHGVSAEVFKKLAGFNHTTGLVSADLHKVMSLRMQQWCEDNNPGGVFVPTENTVRKNIRLEGKEHQKKTRALIKSGQYQCKKTVLIKNCKNCRKTIKQPAMGHRLYCDNGCRQKYYNRKNAECKYGCICQWCSKQFMGNVEQYRRQLKGLAIACCIKHRQYLNASKKRKNK
jgi:hypothetical protein